MTIASIHIKDLLVINGFKFNEAVATDWNLWIGKQPDSPDRSITIYDTPGLAPNPRWLLDYPSVQIRVRGNPNDYETAANKIQEVKDLILGIPSYTTSGGDRINHINGIGEIDFRGWDDQKRPSFTANYRLIIEPATNSNTNREPL